MSLHLLLIQYTNSLDFDKIEDYQFQVGDVWVSPLANRLVEPTEDNAFRKYIIRNIEDKDKTEIFYCIGLTRNKVIHSNGKCRRHKNFSKIVKAVNDMRTQNQ